MLQKNVCESKTKTLNMSERYYTLSRQKKWATFFQNFEEKFD
jgi:hypothetical protein